MSFRTITTQDPTVSPRNPRVVVASNEDYKVFRPHFFGNGVEQDVWTDRYNQGKADVPGGQVKIDTTAGDDAGNFALSGIKDFDPALGCGVHWRMKVADRGTSLFSMGFNKGAGEQCEMIVNAGDDNIDFVADGGTGDALNEDTGVDLDTSWHEYTIICNADGSADFYIDNVLTSSAGANALSVIEGGQAMYLRFYIEDTAIDQTIVYIDEVIAWQKRTNS